MSDLREAARLQPQRSVTELQVSTLTRPEAQQCITAVRSHLLAAQRQAYRFHAGRGWLALGYDTLASCLAAEFGASSGHYYRLVRAGRLLEGMQAVAASVPWDTAPPALPQTIRERHARELNRLADDTARVRAWSQAQQMAAAEGGALVQQRHIAAAVRTLQAEQAVFNSPYKPVAHMLTTGDLTAAQAQQMTAALNQLHGAVLVKLLALITRHTLTCADLILPLAALFAREGTDNPSRTLAGILATGCVAGTPLRKATLTDLARAKAEAQRERLAEQEEARRRAALAAGKPLVEPLVITVYRGSPERTLKALREALPVMELIRLQWLLEA